MKNNLLMKDMTIRNNGVYENVFSIFGGKYLHALLNNFLMNNNDDGDGGGADGGGDGGGVDVKISLLFLSKTKNRNCWERMSEGRGMGRKEKEVVESKNNRVG